MRINLFSARRLVALFLAFLIISFSTIAQSAGALSKGEHFASVNGI